MRATTAARIVDVLWTKMSDRSASVTLPREFRRMSASAEGPASLVGTIRAPQDLRGLTEEQLTVLAAEIRDFLVDKVSRTGGHLGPNLGVVELTLALHRVFDSPKDRILFDIGHQAYVHKIVTGRQDGFDLLRQRGGMSGYPSQAESEHDLIENSHASTALSYADGLAKAYALSGEKRHVVAVVGDGALTGGMCWEALNNIAGAKNPLVIVVNDNGRSYAPTIGGLADHLATLRLNPGYEKVLDLIKDALEHTPIVGGALYEVLHGLKKGMKDAIAPQAMFEDLGIKYVGPVDGHDLPAVESVLRRAKAPPAASDGRVPARTRSRYADRSLTTTTGRESAAAACATRSSAPV
jgi:1-deoxy-D-xylulose-5-phosphate synthase